MGAAGDRKPEVPTAGVARGPTTPTISARRRSWVALGAIVAAVLDAAPVPSFAGGLENWPGAARRRGRRVGRPRWPLCPQRARSRRGARSRRRATSGLRCRVPHGRAVVRIRFGSDQKHARWRAALARLLGAVVLAARRGRALRGDAEAGERPERRTPTPSRSRALDRRRSTPRRGRGPHGSGAGPLRRSDQALATKTGLAVKTVSAARRGRRRGSSTILERRRASDEAADERGGGGAPRRRRGLSQCFSRSRRVDAALHYACRPSPRRTTLLRLGGERRGPPRSRRSRRRFRCSASTRPRSRWPPASKGRRLEEGLAFAFRLAAPATNASTTSCPGEAASPCRDQSVEIASAAPSVLSYARRRQSARSICWRGRSDGGGGGGLELPGLVRDTPTRSSPYWRRPSRTGRRGRAPTGAKASTTNRARLGRRVRHGPWRDAASAATPKKHRWPGANRRRGRPSTTPAPRLARGNGAAGRVARWPLTPTASREQRRLLASRDHFFFGPASRRRSPQRKRAAVCGLDYAIELRRRVQWRPEDAERVDAVPAGVAGS